MFGPDELSPTDADLFNSNAFAELRALLLFWMADHLTVEPQQLRGAREKVVVGMADSPSSEAVLRRAARLAQRSRAQMVGVHVSDQHRGDDVARATRKDSVERLGGSYYEVTGDDVPGALLSFAAAQHATQLVLGGSFTSGWSGRFRRTLTDKIIRDAIGVDVHVVSAGHAVPSASREYDVRRRAGLRREVAGAALGMVVMIAMTAVLAAHRGTLSVATSLALYLLVVVGITAVGGKRPGLAAAVVAPLLANWYLIAPLHTLRIKEVDNVVELLVFVSVASIVSTFVSIAERNATEAAQRTARGHEVGFGRRGRKSRAARSHRRAIAPSLRARWSRGVGYSRQRGRGTRPQRVCADSPTARRPRRTPRSGPRGRGERANAQRR